MTADFGIANRQVDPLLLGACLALAALGTVMVGSASIAFADQNMGEPLYFLVRHLGALGLGCVAAFVAMSIPTELWYRLSGLFLIMGIGLLALVLVPSIGDTVNGSTRWIVLGPLRFQASEPARLCLLMYLASYAVRHHREFTATFVGFLKPIAIMAFACVLLLAEPDFGAAVVLTATSLGVLFVAGARLRHFTVAVAVAAATFGALAISVGYRVQRLAAFLDPWEDPFNTGFQLTNSLIAIGRGEWFGVGLGASVQKLFYLPEAHTDFVFAVLAEELGLLGSTLVIALFALIVYRAITLGKRALAAGMAFQGLLCTGIGVMLALEAGINIGVNTGLLPTKGLTLPLISYGRSSTVVTLVALGLLLRVYHELRAAERHPPRRRSQHE